MSQTEIPTLSPKSNQKSGSSIRKNKDDKNKQVKILLVTPEICDSIQLASTNGKSPCIKAGGLADISGLLMDSLTAVGAEVHVALPNFRSMMGAEAGGHSHLLHLCEDREFCYRQAVYDGDSDSNLRAALAFQRDVIQYIIPKFKPDLVHCNDWMTGLVPAAARAMGIPSVFTLHNLHDERTTLAHIEDRGIDSASFWDQLYYARYPANYEETRNHNRVSFLASGIHAASRVNTVSVGFLHELANGQHMTSPQVIDALHGKVSAGHAVGILNSLPDNRSPQKDTALTSCYDAASHVEGKAANKATLQRILGLEENSGAPLFFWPSRLDPMQKGCQLLAEILQQLVAEHGQSGIQFVFIADGAFYPHFENIIAMHGLHRRVALRKFHDPLSRHAYAASDFILMPSSFEPCGLAQMIAMRYGSLPVVHATGGLRDTVSPMDAGADQGNGFPFDFHDAAGLRWAIGQALEFHALPADVRARQIARVMSAAETAYRPAAMIDQYRQLYQDALGIPHS